MPITYRPSSIRRAPRRRRRTEMKWLRSSPQAPATAALAVTFAANGAFIFAWLARLPDVQTKLGIDIPTLAWIAFAVSAGGVIGSHLAATVMARYGTTLTTSGGAVAALAGTALAAVTTSVEVVIVAIAVAGVGDGLQDVGMNASAVSHQSRLGRPILQRLHGFWSGGALLGAGVAAAAAMLRLPLAVHIVGFNLVLLLVQIPALRALPEERDPAGIGRPRMSRLARLRNQPEMRQAVTIIGVLVLLAAVIEGIPSEWPPVLLANERGVATGAAAVAAVLYLGAGAAARMAGDHLIARYGTDTVLTGGLGLAVLGSIAGFGIASPAAVYLGVVAMGAGAAFMFPVLFMLAGEDEAIGPGDGAALVSTVGRIGFILYPPLIAILEPMVGLGVTLQLAAIAGLAALTIVWTRLR